VRATAAALVVLVALAAASGASARDPKDPQQRHTAADTRLAKSIALVASDLASGWKLMPPGSPAAPCSTEPDESHLVQTARVDPTFVWKDGVTKVGSEVDVFRTAHDALVDWRLSTVKLMRDCLLETLRKAVGKKGTVKATFAKALQAPKLGERALHYRVVFVVNGNVVNPIVTELVAVGVGRISAVLHTLSFGAPPAPSAVQSLSSTLAKRLVAASGGI
jgi:hypothetical protein